MADTTPEARRTRRARPSRAVATTERAGPAVDARSRSPREHAAEYQSLALVLQGGGALGAYQCGVYESLHAAGLRPDWFVGTSIGAINAAILAGNPPQRRVERLHEFWDLICQPVGPAAGAVASGVRMMMSWAPHSEPLDAWANSLGAMGAMLFGQRGFFDLRLQPPFLRNDGSPAATSFYDTTPLATTLERLVDFDRINGDRSVRLTVGATNVLSGNDHYFDSWRDTIGPEHIMASGALPPAFPAIEIDGKPYWDGGIVSNTPLERVWNDRPRRDTLVLQVDIWSARGRLPRTMMDVLERQKDIQFSSRTRLVTDKGASMQKLRLAIGELLAQLPPESIDEHLRATLAPWACTHVFNIVHLIYQAKPYEGQYKDYAFGPGAQRAHWAEGLADMERTLKHADFFARPSHELGVVTHDVHRAMNERKAAP